MVRTLRLALAGESAGLLHLERELEPVEIELEMARAERSSVADLGAIRVASRSGALVPLAERVISADGWRTRLPQPPSLSFSADRSYFWELETNVGSVRVKLLPDVAPAHVSSTIYLTRLGFYDGLAFHRVIPERPSNSDSANSETVSPSGVTTPMPVTTTR